MNRKSIPLEVVALIYFLVLGIAALFNKFFPEAAASAAYFLIPFKTKALSSDYVRYRMVLFIVCTALLILLTPLIGYLGLRGANNQKVRAISWWSLIPMLLVMLICWVFFPSLALCTTCLTGNDIIYFFVVMFLFLAIQLVIQTAVLRTKLGFLALLN